MLRTDKSQSARRWLCAAAVVATWALGHGGTAVAFDIEDVVAKAAALAEKPYEATKVPQWLLDINYDQWRDIRFRTERTLWRGTPSPFQVQFFHPGLYFDRTVLINEVDDTGAHPITSSSEQFNYGKNDFGDRVPRDLGYAGFRIHYPLNKPEYYDELIVFLGASYFRALGRHQVYGLSARGIAIDTVAPTPEEFPYFREFWLVRPAADATQMVVYALLDGPSVTGAYRFTIQPGDQTAVHVEARVILRRPVGKLGIAPFTSMFFHGENTLQPAVDYRPEVHDSDGLLLNFDNGEWLWRPLDNARSMQVNSLQMHNPRGFGLLQRDRDFSHHQDLETRTDLRPSVWITTHGDWGDGHIELMQLPTDTDIHDNIVAYWVPASPPLPGVPVSFSYSMYWYGDDPSRPPGGRLVATRRDYGTFPGGHRFVLDFEGAGLSAIPEDRAPRGVITIAGGDEAGEVLDYHVVKNPVTGGWRVTFQVRAKKPAPLELRCFLERDGEALSETWSYAVLP